MAPPPPPSASQTSSASSNIDYDTSTETAAAATPIEASQPPPPSTENQRDECVLCCYPLPIKENECLYKECCGELICCGCIVAQRRTLIIGTNVTKPIKNSKEEELEFNTILASEQIMVCPFCRAKVPTNDKEYLKRLWERIDEYKDPKAMCMLGVHYVKGERGLSKNRKKAMELYQQAYDLGDLPAAYNLSLHVPDPARRMKYLEAEVKRGNASCMNHLGALVARSGNHEEANRHFMAAARSGDNTAMNNLMVKYRTPGIVLSKDDLTTTLRAYKAVNDRGKSEPREYAIRYETFLESKCKDRSVVADHGRRV